jgi:hypothetical protein
MTSPVERALEAVHVHIASSDVPLAPAPAPAPKKRNRRKTVTFRTILLSATNPTDDVWGQDESRVEGWLIQYGDNDFVLCQSNAQLDNAAASASFANGVPGTLIPKALAVPIPCHTTDHVLVTAIAFPTKVGVIEIRQAED